MKFEAKIQSQGHVSPRTGNIVSQRAKKLLTLSGVLNLTGLCAYLLILSLSKSFKPLR